MTQKSELEVIDNVKAKELEKMILGEKWPYVDVKSTQLEGGITYSTYIKGYEDIPLSNEFVQENIVGVIAWIENVDYKHMNHTYEMKYTAFLGTEEFIKAVQSPSATEYGHDDIFTYSSINHISKDNEVIKTMQGEVNSLSVTSTLWDYEGLLSRLSEHEQTKDIVRGNLVIGTIGAKGYEHPEPKIYTENTIEKFIDAMLLELNKGNDNSAEFETITEDKKLLARINSITYDINTNKMVRTILEERSKDIDNTLAPSTTEKERTKELEEIIIEEKIKEGIKNFGIVPTDFEGKIIYSTYYKGYEGVALSDEFVRENIMGTIKWEWSGNQIGENEYEMNYDYDAYFDAEDFIEHIYEQGEKESDSEFERIDWNEIRKMYAGANLITEKDEVINKLQKIVNSYSRKREYQKHEGYAQLIYKYEALLGNLPEKLLQGNRIIGSIQSIAKGDQSPIYYTESEVDKYIDAMVDELNSNEPNFNTITEDKDILEKLEKSMTYDINTNKMVRTILEERSVESKLDLTAKPGTEKGGHKMSEKKQEKNEEISNNGQEINDNISAPKGIPLRFTKKQMVRTWEHEGKKFGTILIPSHSKFDGYTFVLNTDFCYTDKKNDKIMFSYLSPDYPVTLSRSLDTGLVDENGKKEYQVEKIKVEPKELAREMAALSQDKENSEYIAVTFTEKQMIDTFQHGDKTLARVILPASSEKFAGFTFLVNVENVKDTKELPKKYITSKKDTEIKLQKSVATEKVDASGKTIYETLEKTITADELKAEMRSFSLSNLEKNKERTKEPTQSKDEPITDISHSDLPF